MSECGDDVIITHTFSPFGSVRFEEYHCTWRGLICGCSGVCLCAQSTMKFKGKKAKTKGRMKV